MPVLLVCTYTDMLRYYVVYPPSNNGEMRCVQLTHTKKGKCQEDKRVAYKRLHRLDSRSHPCHCNKNGCLTHEEEMFQLKQVRYKQRQSDWLPVILTLPVLAQLCVLHFHHEWLSSQPEQTGASYSPSSPIPCFCAVHDPGKQQTGLLLPEQIKTILNCQKQNQGPAVCWKRGKGE